MPSRESYNACMVPWIRGEEGLDRRTSFCVGAKLCSGKAKNKEEAKEQCSKAFNKRLGIQNEPLRLDIDDLNVVIDGKQVIVSPELITKLCGCRSK